MSLSPSLDYYAILGLTYEATADEIRAAYRQIARRFHPDVNPNQGAGLHFRDVVEAYDTLSNETQHRRYRQQRKQYGRLPSFNFELTTSKRVLQTIAEPQVLYV
jgi:curved DNA-binding protein